MIRQIVTRTSANSISAINSDSNFSISIKIGYDKKNQNLFLNGSRENGFISRIFPLSSSG